MRTVYLGLGSNLGDRQANILHALQKLRSCCRVAAVSSYYETRPAEGADGPSFLNVAAIVDTDMPLAAFEQAVRRAESAVGRQHFTVRAARPIDIDILYFETWHTNVRDRPYNLIPLAEIAPQAVDASSNVTLAELAKTGNHAGIVKNARGLQFVADRQDGAPDVALSIERAGVAGVKRVVHLDVDGKDVTYNAVFSMVADLAPDRAGVHMSRFSELLEHATLEVLSRSDRAPRLQDVVASIALEVVALQHASQAEIRLRADFGLERWTPVSGKRGEETYTLVAVAHADARGVRHAIGVEAEGMTACPCAQGMVREHGLHELSEAGFSQEDAKRALDALPVATHNQRSRGTIWLGVPAGRERDVEAADLVEIVENSMSSETYDLLKRPDEFFVVNKAHHNPKFVEDVVRGIMARTLQMYADFPDDACLETSQINYESIHKHDAFAEAFGTFGELRQELKSGRRSGRKTDLAAWLRQRP